MSNTPLLPEEEPFSFNGQAVADSIASMLNEVAECAGSSERFKGDYTPPSDEEITECYRRNCTVQGRLYICPENDGAWPRVEIPVFHPYHGVFILGNRNGGFERPARAKLVVWHPCLVRRQGLWIIDRTQQIASYDDDATNEDGDNRSKCRLEVEISFLANRAYRWKWKMTDEEFQILNEAESLAAWRKGKRKRKSSTTTLDDDSEEDPESEPEKKKYQYVLPSKFTLGFDASRDQLDKWTQLQPLVALLSDKSRIRHSISPIGKQFNNDQLQFEIYQASRLKHARIEYDDLNTKRLFTYGVFLAETIVEYFLIGWFDNNGKLKPTYWTSEEASGDNICDTIRKRIFKSNEKSYSWLRPFSPRNGADAASALTALSRHGWPKDQLGRLPIEYHQNHPSFFQKICPVETPESEMIGLTLHLAAGAKAGSEGVLTASPDSHGLGYAASLIPFYQHTDAARAMVGAKNYVQARPVAQAEPPLVQTGMEQGIERVLRPLIQQGLIPSEAAFMHPGRNLLVAYMPYFGYNYNDAVVVSEELRASMLFEKREESTPKYDEYGNITYPEDSPVPLNLELGDKLMGRHGNKGVVGALLPPDKMPRLPEDPRLGELSGRAVDIVLNPLGVISRMNLGQLLETHVGLLKKLGADNLPENIGQPFATFDPEAIRERLLAINAGGDPLIDSCGRMTLTIPSSLVGNATDLKTASPVVVGMQYFVRLDHVPSEKANFRDSDPKPNTYDSVTGQPMQGRTRKGGQRIGNMEFWALEAYGAESIIKRFLTDRFKPKPKVKVAGEDLNQSQTFRAVRAFLRVLGVAIDGPDENKHYQARWTDDEENVPNACELHYIHGVPEWRKGYSGSFTCSHAKCDLTIGSVGTLTTQKDNMVRVCVEDLLREHKIDMSDCDYSRELLDGAPTEIVAGVTLQSTAPDHWTLTVGKKEFHVYKPHMKVRCVSDVMQLPIACKKHTSKVLEASVEKLEKVDVPSFGGLSDPSVFRDRTFSWGFIRLPSPVSATEVQGKWAVGRGDFKFIPILPRRYRQNSWGEDDVTKPHDITKLYEKLADAAIDPDTTETKRVKAAEAKRVKAVKNLFDQIKSALDGKEGLVKGDGYRRRVDNSGRFVIVPDPSLAWDECGLPVSVLKQMYPKGSVLSEMPAEPTDEDLAGYAPPPDRFVLVNRQPSLHRYSFKALRPVPLRNPGRSEKSKVIAINPLVCASMGADYDGDDMAVFVLDPGEKDDARKMLPTARENLLSLANGAPLAGFDQDMVLGSYLASRSAGADFIEFRRGLLFDGCERCDAFANTHWDSDKCLEILRHLCEHHTDPHDNASTQKVVSSIVAWMARSFAFASRIGSTIGFFDLMACRPKGIEAVSQPVHDDDLKERLDVYLGAILDSADLNAPGYHSAAMVRSKAKGDKQIMQVVVSRGELQPGDVLFDIDPQHYRFDESLLAGAASPLDAFNAAMNGRHTMAIKKFGTAMAGSLTNDLMAICRPWRIKGDACVNAQDLSSPKEHAICANEEYAMCRKHYGSLPDGSSPLDGFLIGVIAAQTIGERGTQLSMKASKTGDIRSDTSSLIQILDSGEPFVDTDKFKKLLEPRSDFAGYFPVHFIVVQEAIQRTIFRKKKRSLANAVTAQAEGNLFNALASDRMWEKLAKMIRLRTSSHVGDLRAEEMALRKQSPLPDFIPSPSSVARILIGYPGEHDEKPSGYDACSEYDDMPVLYMDEEDIESYRHGTGLPILCPSSWGAIQTHTTVDETPTDEIDPPDDEDDGDDEDADKPKDWRPGGLSTERARIALVMIHVGGKRRCHVEIPDRSPSDANLPSLARYIAAWAQEEKTLENSDSAKPIFKTQKDMVAAILKAAGKVAEQKDEQEMTAFMKRAFIYWKDRVLPASILVK